MTVTVGGASIAAKQQQQEETNGHTGAEANGDGDMNEKRYLYRVMLQGDITR